MNKRFQHITGLFLTAAALAGASAVQAQSSSSAQNTGGPFAWNGSPKAYIDLSAGQTDYRLNNGTGVFASDNRSSAYTLSAGAYFTNNLGLEAGYTDFGRINRVGGSTRAEGLSLRLVGKLPLAPSLNLLGKIGTIYGRTDVGSAAGSGVTAGAENGWGLSMGIGAEYLFTPNWSAVLQYDAHDLRFAGASSDRERLGVTSLGVRYAF